MAQVIEREVVREPVATHSNTNGVVVAVLVIALILLALYFFGNGARLFSGYRSAPAVSVPKQIDVNVNSGGGTGGESAPQAPTQ